MKFHIEGCDFHGMDGQHGVPSPEEGFCRDCHDQERYLAAVEYHCDGLHVAVGCLGAECEYADGDDEHACESSFSWSDCDSCGSSLGGDRYPAYGTFRDDSDELQLVPLYICVDCVLFHANGVMPEEG